MIRVNIREFLDKFMKYASIPDTLFWELSDKESRGCATHELPQCDYDKILKTYEDGKKREDLLSKTADLNNKGLESEKAGNITDAIRLYEECISLGYDARHSYDRLLVIYRRNKDYTNELRVAITAAKVFKTELKYKERIEKINSILNKSSK